MIAFHGKQEIKDKYLARVGAHALDDEIVKGQYWENGKGCAVGCTIHSSDHCLYESELGIPMIIARLEDYIFEALPLDLAKTWPERFLKAIPVGSDLSKIWPRFAIWLLTDETHGAINFSKDSKHKEIIKNVSNLYLTGLKQEVSIAEWGLAADAADPHTANYGVRAAYYLAYGAGCSSDFIYAICSASLKITHSVSHSEKVISLLAEAPVKGKE